MPYLARLIQIAVVLGGYLIVLMLGRWRHRPGKITPAQKLCRALEKLGGSFVKLGQALSLRHDLLPNDYIIALQALQDDVLPFPGAIAINEVEKALANSVENLFAEFDITPLAAASIAQVHKVHLHDGRLAVVKVRRPGIKTQIDQDMRILKILLRSLMVLIPALQQYQPLEIIREIWANLRKETDFRQEARNIRRFVEAFKDSQTVHIPSVVDELYAESVLVQEMSSGLRVDDPGIKGRGPQLAQSFVEAYVHQFFVIGVFHGDPHPGNLFIMDDNRICFHDFGMVGFLDRSTRKRLAALMQAFARQDSDWMFDSYLDLGVLGGELDRGEFRRGLEEMLEDYSHTPLKDWSFAEAFVRIAHLGRGQNIRIPHNLLVLMRAMFIMENTVRSLDPDFNLMDGLLGRAEQLATTSPQETNFNDATARLRYESVVALQEMPATLSALLRRLRRDGLQLRIRHHGLEDLEKHLDRSSNRMALALVTLGLYIAASLLMQNSAGPRIAGMPVFAIMGYGLALWFTFRLVKGISRSGRL